MTASASPLPEVQSLLQRLESEAQLRRFFPRGGVAIYQVPLPEQGAELRYDRQSNYWRVKPGECLYVIDSAPLGLFTKPTAIAVFGENSREPRLFAVGHWNLFIDERAFPFWDSAVLQQWAVHQDQPRILADEAIIIKGKKDKKDSKPEEQKVVTGPIYGPFPPKDPAEPGDSDPYPVDPTLTKPDPTACVPRLLFYAICCENNLETVAGTNVLWNETKEVADAFEKRGYTTAKGLAGSTAPDGGPAGTFDEMMDGLAKKIAADAIAQTNKFCQCPADQLVIWIAGHGDKGFFQWKPDSQTSLDIFYPQLMKRLLDIPEIKNNPQKVYLLFLGCRSGTLWTDGLIPPGLAGLHLITSSPDNETNSRSGTFTRWVVEAVQKAKNWAQFIAILRYLHRDSAQADKSRPRSGDIAGCFATGKLVEIAFAGDDVGFMKDYATSVYGQLYRGTEHLFHGHSVKPGAIIFNAFFGPCGPGKSVDIVVEPRVQNNANDFLPLHEVTQSIPFACDKHTHQGEIAVPLKNNNLTATITFKFEITSNCK